MGDILGSVVVVVILIGVLWWLWQGIKGTWYIVVYFFHKVNTCLLIVLGLIFGWNIISGMLAFLVCLGPITIAIAEGLWAGEISQ